MSQDQILLINAQMNVMTRFVTQMLPASTQMDISIVYAPQGTLEMEHCALQVLHFDNVCMGEEVKLAHAGYNKYLAYSVLIVSIVKTVVY